MKVRQTSTLRLETLLAVVVLVVAACGGGDNGGGGGGSASGGGGGGGGNELSLSTVDNSFDPNELSAPAGARVTVTVTNEGQNPHTFSSDEVGFDSGVLNPGDSKSVSFTMPDSPTEFICKIHASIMTGTLTPQS